MHQAVLAWQYFDEATVGQYTHHLAQVNLAYLGFLGQALNQAYSFLGALTVCRGHEHRAVVLNVYLRAGLPGNAANVLAAGAYQSADLLRVDLDTQDTRRKLRQRFARLGYGLVHLLKYVHASFAGLGDGLVHNLESQPLGLEV